jgi:mannitol-1-phosphate/altronate dehydrogenase
MVDRITPATTDEDRAEVVDVFDIVDRAPVMTEPFTQWVIEDCFSDGRPPLDTVGARFVADVAPYKLIKSRMLNGTHCALGYIGVLAGHARTDDAMADPLIFDFVSRLLEDEIAPLLPADVEGMELDAYRATLLERLTNPAIGDPLARLCRRGSTKMVDYLLPSLHEARRQNRPFHLLTVALAAWCLYLRGTDLSGEPIDVQDDRHEELQPLALRTAQDATDLLSVSDIFGDLGNDSAFCAEVTRLVRLIDKDGMGAALQAPSPGLAA